MHQPTRTAGPALSSFGWALSLSVCIHGAVLATWLYARRDQGAVSIGHKRGALTVQLRTWVSPHGSTRAPKAAQPSMGRPAKARPHLITPQPVAVAPKPVPRDAHAAEAAPAIVSSEPPAPPQVQPANEAPASAETPPAPPPSPPAQPAGARFANLFAPIVSRPLGRGRWSTQPVNMATQAQAAMQREQAIQGLRQTLQVRTDALRAELQAQPLSGRCEVRVALERQTARIQCDQATDQQRLIARLGDVIRIQPEMAQSPSDNCLSVSERALQWQDCAITAQP